MIKTHLPFSGVYLLKSEPFVDERGMFARIYCERELADIGVTGHIVQSNVSRNSTPGTLRGMHYRTPHRAETKIVNCIRGAVFDVVVDLRQNSSTFLEWHGEILSADTMRSILIPPGVAHGFQVLEPESELLYFHTEFYSADHEEGFSYRDPSVGIQWPLDVAVISRRDDELPCLDTDFVEACE